MQGPKELGDKLAEMYLKVTTTCSKSVYEDDKFIIKAYGVNSSYKYAHPSVRIDIQDKELADYT